MKHYVIGNSFDPHHGIRSSFEDFARYVQREHRDVANAVERYLPAVDENWCNLEAALAQLDYEGVVDDCGIFVPSYGADARRQSWEWETGLSRTRQESAWRRLKTLGLLEEVLLGVAATQICLNTHCSLWPSRAFSSSAQ